MFHIILTTLLYLTQSFSGTNSSATSNAIGSTTEQPFYNIHDWVKNLNLQRCSFVEVGIKYFAIFVEDDVVRKKGQSRKGQHYFLGICNMAALTEWKLCSPELFKVRHNKCRFKLGRRQYHIRVHRRFCDFNVMVNNKDCMCGTTIFGEQLYKVIGFPTCYVAPSPESLCKYFNVCGLSPCEIKTIEGRVHTVECNPNCRGRQPYCEYPVGERSSRLPRVTSSWSEWQDVVDGGEAAGAGVQISTCINKHTKRGALDCLGPGTGCCPREFQNCYCQTFIDNGVLKVKRHVNYNQLIGVLGDNYPFKETSVSEECATRETIPYDVTNSAEEEKEEDTVPTEIYDDHLDQSWTLNLWTSSSFNTSTTSSMQRFEDIIDKVLHIKKSKREATDMTTEIFEDDDDEDDLGDEDIVLEEGADNEEKVSTTESLEKDELKLQETKEIQVPKNFTDPSSENNEISKTPNQKMKSNANTFRIYGFLISIFWIVLDILIIIL